MEKALVLHHVSVVFPREAGVLSLLLVSICLRDIQTITAPTHSQLFAENILLDTSSASVSDINHMLSIAGPSLA